MMFHIDAGRCTGCGACVDICPEAAISVRNNVAVIDPPVCRQCGSCAEVCAAGAIRVVEPVYAQSWKGGDIMAYGYGRGFGFRGASPPWPYVGRGRGGLPRCWHPGLWGVRAYGPTPYPYYGATPYAPPLTGEAELDSLKNEAEAIREELGRIEARIRDLEGSK